MYKKLFIGLCAFFSLAGTALSAAVMSYSNYTTPQGNPLIIPEVSSYKKIDGTLKLPADFTVSVQQGEELIIEQFAADLKKFPAIKVSAAVGNAFCRFILTDKEVPENKQGYTVDINENGITIKSRSKAGLFYGAQTLRNIFRNAATAEIGLCRISDFPDFELRCYNLDIRNLRPHRIGTVKKSIDALAAFKINTLFLTTGETFPYKNNPFTRRRIAHSRESLTSLLEMCRKRHIQVIPSLQILSHTAWMAGHPNWDKIKEGVPNKTWNSAPCPQNQEGRDLVAMALNEQIDFFKSDFFYIVYDEIVLCPFRQCPKCKDADPKKLLADYMKFVSGVLKKRGVRPIVCQDSFITTPYWSLGDWHRTQLPENAVIRWWTYRDKMLNTDKIVHFSNFDLMGNAVCGKPFNTFNMAHLIKKHNGIGCGMTYWYYSNTGVFANLVQETPDSLGGIVNGSGYYWRLTDQHHAEITYDGTLEMMRILYPEQLNLPPRNAKAAPIPLYRYANSELSGSGHFPRFDSDKQTAELAKALAELPERFQLMTSPGGKYYALRASGSTKGRQGILFDMHDRKFEILSLLLTASRPRNGMEYFAGNNIYGPKRFTYAPAASISIRYTDGTSVRIPLRYRRDITDWNRPFGGFNMRWAVRGLDADKKYYSFGIYDLKNPHPEKPVSGITFGTLRLDHISPALLAASVWDIDKAVPFRKQQINLKRYAKQSHPVDSKPVFNTVFDFEKGMPAGLEVTAPEKLRKAMKVEIVDDPSSPTGSKVLKITIPAGKYKGRARDLGFLRVSVDMPYTITPRTQSLVSDIKLKADSNDLNHVNLYLISQMKYSPKRLHRYFRLPVATDGRWYTHITSIRRQRNLLGDMKNVNIAKGRRISFFFKSFEHPVEIYVDNIGDTRENISNVPVWKEGAEAETFG